MNGQRLMDELRVSVITSTPLTIDHESAKRIVALVDALRAMPTWAANQVPDVVVALYALERDVMR